MNDPKRYHRFPPPPPPPPPPLPLPPPSPSSSSNYFSTSSPSFFIHNPNSSPNPNPNPFPTPLLNSDPASLRKPHAIPPSQLLLRTNSSINNFPPLSPQESNSTLTSSDRSSNSVSSSADHHRCYRSSSSCHSPLRSSFNKPRSNTYSSYGKTVSFSDLPIVQGPVDVQPPPAASPSSSCPYLSPSAQINSTIASQKSSNEVSVQYSRSSLKRRLEDLERELLNDEDGEGGGGGNEASMETSMGHSTLSMHAGPAERDWTDVIEDLLTDTVITSIDQSTITSINSCAEESSSPAAISSSAAKLNMPSISSSSSPSPSPSSSSPSSSSSSQQQSTELLMACAKAIDREDFNSAEMMLSCLEQSASIYGDPAQRMSAYMAAALSARIHLMRNQPLASSPQNLHNLNAHTHMAYNSHSIDDINNNSSKNNYTNNSSYNYKKMIMMVSGADILRGNQLLHRWSPYFKFGHFAANAAIAEAFQCERSIHIVDFNIGHGNQWLSLINAFSQRPGGAPHVRITGITHPKSATCLEAVEKRLCNYAANAGVSFEFRALKMDASSFEPSMLDRRPNEALAVNFVFHLHRMPDESMSTSNPRDTLLRKVKSMQPKIVTLVERDANTNTAPFYPRFVETLNYFGAMFESLDQKTQDGKSTRDDRDRVNAEQHCLARDIMNIIAFEGESRTERYEVAGKWRARITMAGFRNIPMSSYITGSIQGVLQHYSPKYRLREEGGFLHLDWVSRSLVSVSAWH